MTLGRQAWVGLEGPGRVDVWPTVQHGVLGAVGCRHTWPDIHGIGALDNFLPNARSDNTVVYKGTYKGLTLGASYSFGRDSAGRELPGQAMRGSGSGPVRSMP